METAEIHFLLIIHLQGEGKSTQPASQLKSEMTYVNVLPK